MSDAENTQLVVKSSDYELQVATTTIQNKYIAAFDALDHVIALLIGKPPVMLERDVTDQQLYMNQTALIMYEKKRLYLRKTMTGSALTAGLSYMLYKFVRMIFPHKADAKA